MSETKGAGPMIGEGPVVEINDEEYKMRRLGISDTFKLMQIIAGGAAGLGAEMGNITLDQNTVTMLLVAGLPYAEKQAMSLLADIIGVEYEDITDPEQFPMGSEIDIIEKLIKHQDIKAFLDKLGKLMKVKGMKGFLNKA